MFNDHFSIDRERCISPKEKFIVCDTPEETASEIKKTVSLPNMGIRVEVPANYRAVGRKDDSTLFVDNGTYKYLQCVANNPGAGGRGIFGFMVERSKANYLYSNVQDEVPGKPNFFIVWEKQPLGEETSHLLSLRIKTQKGIIEVTEVDGNGPITTETEAIQQRNNLVELASIIEII